MNDGVLLALEQKIEGITRKINEVTFNVLAEMVVRADRYSPVGDVHLWENPKSAPKGYVGGQFRGNWKLSVDEPDLTFTKGLIDSSGSTTVANNIQNITAKYGINRVAYGHRFYLTNNCPYAVMLEQGWSKQKQAALGILWRVQNEMPIIIREVVDEIKAGGGRVR